MFLPVFKCLIKSNTGIWIPMYWVLVWSGGGGFVKNYCVQFNSPLLIKILADVNTLYCIIICKINITQDYTQHLFVVALICLVYS